MSRTGKAFLYLVYFVMVAVLCGFIITSTKSKAPKVAQGPAPARPAQPSKPAAPKPAPSKHGKTPAANTPSVAQNQNQTPATAQTQTPAAAGSSSALADTGPGDVAGLFIAVTLVSALAYRRALIKE